MTVETGTLMDIQITDISNEGNGIGKNDGMAFFIPHTLPGDYVRAEVLQQKKSYGIGRLVEILEPSKDRIESACPLSEDCGGCQLQGFQYESQLKWKENLVRDKFIRLAKIDVPPLSPILGMDKPMYYRNKSQMPVEYQGSLVKVGFYREKSRDIVNCPSCLLQSEPTEVLAQVLREFIHQEMGDAYKTSKKSASMTFIRQLVVRTAYHTGEVMVILVTDGKQLPQAEKLINMMDDCINELPTRFDGVTYSLESIIINEMDPKKRLRGTGKCYTLAGEPVITDTLGNLKFEISPFSFYQVNPLQTERLYDKVKEYAQLTGRETVLDLYCGVGTIGLYLASQAKEVIGIESVKSATLDANRNAVINGIVNARFVCGKVEEELSLLSEKVSEPCVIVLDPPRSGCHPAVLSAIAEFQPEKIIYVSCDPATLARDVKILSESGYKLTAATPVDMFPHTVHVEAVTLLTK